MNLTNIHANVQTLRTIYADLSCIAEYVDEDVVLHTADREIPGRVKRVIGKEAVRGKELDLIHSAEGTLVMEVQDIIANEYFGAVTGNLRMRRDDTEAVMPFCGLWRFRGGRIIEHWENAYDIRAFASASNTPRTELPIAR